MTYAFIETIGPQEFLKHAKQTFAVLEIAKFYEINLRDEHDLSELLKRVETRMYHKEIFYYAFYFAAWIKTEVPSYQRTFKPFDDQVKARIDEGGSLQCLLKDIVLTIGYIKFRRYFELLGVNRVH